uniref:Neurotransmitter-gated ion-channel ligand-binding domain-containing protein n=1 Tax=Panagrolaimus sp. ES5 TaxID=591445 RepID=A0AC34FJM0_9BILA
MDDVLKNHVRQPPLENNKPLRIYIGMYLESLGKFKESEMSYEVDVYLYESWQDKSLAHTSGVWTINDDAHRKKIWLPDLYFANARSAQFHDVTVPNFNLYIDTEGTIAYSLRTTLTVACALDLHDYPMDNQLCSVKALSYSFTEEHVKIRCCLSAEIYLQRSLGHNLLQTYIPLGGIVIVGFTSFFIDRRATPARVTLTFMTLVSLTSLGNGMRFALPQVSYAKVQ